MFVGGGFHFTAPSLLIAGGSNGCSPDAADDPPWDPLFVEQYNMTSGSFQMGGNMSTTCIGHSAIPLADGKVLMLGGVPAVQNLHEQLENPSYAEEYDSATESFSPIAGLTISQERCSATLLGKVSVLIAGGVDEKGHPTSEAGLVDLATGSFTATGGLLTARVGHTATLLNDGRVLVTGGHADFGAGREEHHPPAPYFRKVVRIAFNAKSNPLDRSFAWNISQSAVHLQNSVSRSTLQGRKADAQYSKTAVGTGPEVIGRRLRANSAGPDAQPCRGRAFGAAP